MLLSGTPWIVDNGDAGFTNHGGCWQVTNASARQGTQYTNNKGTGSEKVSWTVTDLAPGWYEVSTTWAPAGNQASDAPYRVFDGDTAEGLVLINQKLTPNDFTAENRGRERLGYYYIENGSIRVQLSDGISSPHDMIVADAVRIEYHSHVQPRISGHHPLSKVMITS